MNAKKVAAFNFAGAGFCTGISMAEAIYGNYMVLAVALFLALINVVLGASYWSSNAK